MSPSPTVDFPHHVGGMIPERSALLLQTPESPAARFRIDVRVHRQAVKIDPAGRRIRVRSLETDEEYWLDYTTLIPFPPGPARWFPRSRASNVP